MVEWKPLNKIVKSISTGLNPRQNFILNEEDASLYYVTVKEITTNKVIFSDSTDRITENAKQIINNRSKLSKGDILFSGIGTIGKVAYVDIPTSNWDCSESVFLIKPNELETKGKYLAYILSSDIAKNQYERGAAGAIMKGVRKATLESLLIPIPSFEEQARIVRILDTFTSAIDNLKEQITQRRKQYEYYRDQLLDLEGNPGVKIQTLGELGTFFGGLTGKSKDDFVEGNAKFVTYMNVFANPALDISMTGIVRIAEEEKQNKIQKGDILFTGSSETPEEAGMSCVVTKDLEGDYYLNSFCFGIRLNQPDQYNLNYLKHILRSYSIRKEIAKSASGVTRFNISKARFGKIKLPISSLQDQQRIVSILDTFEASIQNLEAQLKEREKQYEYYRNKLLTFE